MFPAHTCRIKGYTEEDRIMTYTDDELEELHGAYIELPDGMQKRVTFEQFCAKPSYYVREAAFRSLEADAIYCGDCEFFEEWEEAHPYGDGSACETLCECTGNAQSCPRLLP